MPCTSWSCQLETGDGYCSWPLYIGWEYVEGFEIKISLTGKGLPMYVVFFIPDRYTDRH